MHTQQCFALTARNNVFAFREIWGEEQYQFNRKIAKFPLQMHLKYSCLWLSRGNYILQSFDVSFLVWTEIIRNIMRLHQWYACGFRSQWWVTCVMAALCTPWLVCCPCTMWRCVMCAQQDWRCHRTSRTLWLQRAYIRYMTRRNGKD